jgi:RNA polymerase sigma-70 factor, ECF subfamily
MSASESDFRALYDAHFEFVWRSLRRLGVREPDVLDIAQKVFLIAHLKIAEFKGRSRVTTWLFSICQRVRERLPAVGAGAARGRDGSFRAGARE